jgi:pimeloyl-ACP methyl ester carboxylesterase
MNLDKRKGSPMQLMIPLLSVALVLYVGACLALYFFQRSMIYFPQPGNASEPAARMSLEVGGATLNVVQRPVAGPKALIYFGGNAENVSFNLGAFSSAFPDRAIYLMNYRGYGGSTGAPTEALLHADARALFDKVQRDHADIAVVGRSLGSGVAVRLASERPVSRLVLVTPYDSILDMAAARFPYVPVRWLLTDKFESSRYAPGLKVPTLILQAQYDNVIPGDSTARLNAAFAPGVAKLVVLPDAGHNTVSDSPLYLRAMQEALGAPASR